MNRWKGRTALVTGAYTGIGAGISKALIQHGMNVVGCGRNIEKLNEFAKSVEGKGVFIAVKCDITKEDEIMAMFKEINEKLGGVDVCINNAGCGYAATLLDGETDQWRAMLETNVLGLSVCTREAVHSMKNKGIDDGHIINIGSIFGQYVPKGRPTSHMNATSKIAMKALTEGTRNELCTVGKSFRVTELSPGYVETEFETRMRGVTAAAEGANGIQKMQPEDIAEAVLYILGAPPHVNVTSLVIETTEPWP